MQTISYSIIHIQSAICWSFVIKTHTYPFNSSHENSYIGTIYFGEKLFKHLISSQIKRVLSQVCPKHWQCHLESLFPSLLLDEPSDLSPGTPVPDEDSVVFSKLTYLGCASVNAPRSEVEALRMVSILRSQCQMPLDVTLSVPGVSEGTVRYFRKLTTAVT